MFEILHFLIEEFQNYKLLEFRSNKGHLIKFYRKSVIFMDLVDSKGHEVILNHRIKNFFEIMKLEEIKKAELLDERWNINHVVE